ncbi:hypothetical protein GCM10007894_16750 [Paraferrimonas haliotis]|uniref:Tail specific protease domain-containing protein n=2 Tax=Paraferrimonas haliotis TaxID=2013866 RepID=A0AA37TNG1_9GAMM|nr:hypothetical protein GCM10007894_16750 [Paraferrimonas haliotis]
MTHKLTVAQMRTDVDALLVGAIQRHPNIEEYADLDTLRNYANELKASINAPMTRVEFYRVVGKLTPYFQDGHALLIWPYQELNKALAAGSKTFPFEVKRTKTGSLELRNAYRTGDTVIPQFSEIKSINGIPTSVILENLVQYSSGETRLLREHSAVIRFDTALWAVYGFLDEFTVEFSSDKELKKVTINRQSNWPEVDDTAQEFVPSHFEEPYYYRQLSNDVGFIYLAHFDIEPDEFKRFIDATFSTIRKQSIKHLIIDVRDNSGGNTDTVIYLSRHLADKPFRVISKLKEKLNKDNRGWFNYKGDEGEILTSDWDDWEKPIAENRRFKGDTYLLIGPVTYSASIVLATTLKDNGFATLVGETTGGFTNQSAQGNLFNLPHSQLRAYIATRMLVRPNGDLTRQGVIPHYNVNEFDYSSLGQSIVDDSYQFTLGKHNDKSLHLIRLLLNENYQETVRN